MKTVKFLSLVLILALCLPIFCACSVKMNSNDEASFAPDAGYSGLGGYGTGGTAGEPTPDGAGDSTDTEDSLAPDDKGDGESDGESVITKRPVGLITASAWDDNRYYDSWGDLFISAENNDGKAGRFVGFNWGFNTRGRVTVTVTSNGAPVAGATVSAEDFTAKTNASGIAYVFTSKPHGELTVTSGEYSATAAFTTDERELTVTLDGAKQKRNVIELMFVVDVTGSMGDELYYLKNELSDVVGRVAEQNEGAVINLALLFYRDFVDTEVFKYYDFTNVTDEAGLAAQQAAIDSRNAWGGGDTPEAVDEALELAVGKQWSDDATTKLIFLVLDAPPHSDGEGVDRYRSAVMSAAEKGIRICPIICSGADTLTEYLTREAAICTGGTFVFITDDSGIGNPHHDPELPNTVVEALNSLMVRLIVGYHTGEFADPIPWGNDEALN